MTAPLSESTAAHAAPIALSSAPLQLSEPLLQMLCCLLQPLFCQLQLPSRQHQMSYCRLQLSESRSMDKLFQRELQASNLTMSVVPRNKCWLLLPSFPPTLRAAPPVWLTDSWFVMSSSSSLSRRRRKRRRRGRGNIIRRLVPWGVKAAGQKVRMNKLGLMLSLRAVPDTKYQAGVSARKHLRVLRSRRRFVLVPQVQEQIVEVVKVVSLSETKF